MARTTKATAKVPAAPDSDIDAAEDAPVSAKSVGNIGTLAAQALRLQNEIEAMAERLAEKQEELRSIEEEELPAAMDAANCSVFKTKDGRTIEVVPVIRAAIPKLRETEAFEWLIENGHADLIKHLISVSLGRSEDKRAKRILAALKKLKVEPDDKQFVHPQTLSAFCREQLADGVDLPADILGLYSARVAKFKEPKRKPA